MNAVRTGILYKRVSTEDQGKHGYSLANQDEKGREYAARNNINILAVFEDQFSGESLERPCINEALDFCSSTHVDVVIIHDVDRLSRDMNHHAMLEIQFEGRGTKIMYVLGDHNDDSPESNTIRNIKKVFSEYENKQRRKRLTEGKKTKVKSGKVIVGARPPYGYTCENALLVIDPEEAEVVKKVFNLLLTGHSTRVIAKLLHEEGIPTRGDKNCAVKKYSEFAVWNPASIKRIIVNKVYTGEWYWGKTRLVKVNGKKKQVAQPKSEWIKVDIPRIIDDETFEKAQKQLDANWRRSKRNTHHQYLLQGHLFCSCGRKCTCGFRHTNLNYRCPVRKASTDWQKPCPTGFYSNAKDLEHTVWHAVTELLLNPEYLKQEIEKQRHKSEEDTRHIRDRLEAVKSAITDTKRKLRIVIDQMLDSDPTEATINEVFNEKKTALSKTLKGLEAEQTQIEQTISESTITTSEEESLMRLTDELRRDLDNISFEKKRRVLQVLQIRVQVLDRKVVKLSSIVPFVSVGHNEVDLIFMAPSSKSKIPR